MSDSTLEPLEVITDHSLVLGFIERFVFGGRDKMIGFTKATGYYLDDGKVYAVSIAFQRIKIFDAEVFLKAVSNGWLDARGYIDATGND